MARECRHAGDSADEEGVVLAHLTRRARGPVVRIIPVRKSVLAGWLAAQPPAVRAWLKGTEFKAEPGKHRLVPGPDGGPDSVVVGVEDRPDIWSYGDLPRSLPAGSYRIEARLDGEAATRAALGWALGGYGFTRYKRNDKAPAVLEWPDAADRPAVERAAEAVFLVRDLINTPAEDMGPAELAGAAKKLARAHGARCKLIVGPALLAANYPLVHAVGRASARAPRLIDLRWGRQGPLVALVGKGVCFDSGGLDLKPSQGMLLMKKDMGGAAHVLALAQMIMAARLKLRLRVLVPAVENSVAGNAFRPLDIIKSRKGLTVEIGNTDAEGRLVLCDALAAAAAERPALLVDCATLTGAARVALGPDLPALFCNHEPTAEALLRLGREQDDPLWRLPLHKPYRRQLDSKVADLNNVSSSPHGGAITAALFLSEFVAPEIPWVHIDMIAWNGSARPGRPEGGEAQALRALYALVAETATRRPKPSGISGRKSQR